MQPSTRPHDLAHPPGRRLPSWMLALALCAGPLLVACGSDEPDPNAQPAVTDQDGDGAKDASDNCPAVANPDQADADADTLGDACDDDRDGDGAKDTSDNCPAVANPDQADLDSDTLGDACDDDRDGDGTADASDNCPALANADQADADSDTLGDACDDDRDGDGLANDTDPFPDNPEQTPAAPSGLTASDMGDGTVMLTWTDNSSNERSWIVERRGGGDFREVARPPAAAFWDRTVDAGESYTYRVRAGHPEVGDSDVSNEASVSLGGGVFWRSLDAEWQHTCATDSSGAAFCWGDNDNLQVNGSEGDVRTAAMVGAGTTWLAIRAGFTHTCAISAAHTLHCWGGNAFGEAAPDAVGPNVAEPTQVGNDADWQDVATGTQFTCGIRAGALYCWGSNTAGRLGVGDTTNRTAPTRVGTDADWASVTAGVNHACGLRTDGRMFCWGANAQGQLGDGTTTAHLEPVAVVSGGPWRSAAATGTSTCAIDAGNRLSCWGDNGWGQLGVTPQAPGVPALVDDHAWYQVSGNLKHACGTRVSGELYCWGLNTEGQLGLGDTEARGTPVRVGSDSDWVHVTAGVDHTCATKRGDGGIRCWGDNGQFQVGNGLTSGLRDEPSLLDGSRRFAQVSGYDMTSCGIDDAGKLFCWGQNGEGQAGIDSLENVIDAPTRVGTASNWTRVSTGSAHTCAINAAHELHCWGSGSSGVTGSTNGTAARTPVRMGSDADWETVSVGSYAACAIKLGGTLHCWGRNQHGQLGLGSASTTPVTAPTQVGTHADWEFVTAGSMSACGIRNGGELYCWGWNDKGALGTGDTVGVHVPTRVGSDAGWTSVGIAGYTSACGVRAGLLSCWGENANGGLARADLWVPAYTPQQVGTASDWSGVATTAGSATCARTTGGELFCWGRSDTLLGTSEPVTAPTSFGSIGWAGSFALGGGYVLGIEADTAHLWGWGTNLGGQLGLGPNRMTTPQRVLLNIL